jgi:hypothetical protein
MHNFPKGEMGLKQAIMLITLNLRYSNVLNNRMSPMKFWSNPWHCMVLWVFDFD